MKLDAKTVAGLEVLPGKTERLVFEKGGLTGFGFRIKNGLKTWEVMWTDHAGRQRRKRVGSYPLMNATAARKAASKLLLGVQHGDDPHADRKAARERAQQTLAVVVERYLKDRKGELRARTYEEVERHLSQHWKPLLREGIQDITLVQIADRLDAIKAERGKVAAARARSSLSAVYAFAMSRGLASANPVRLTDRPVKEADIERDRCLDEAEIADVWSACGDDDFGHIVRLLLLTAQRRDEVGNMCWSEVDIEAGMWTIPADRAKNGREHVVPLGTAVIALLQALPRREGRDLVFGRREGGFSGWSKAKAQLDERIAMARKKAGRAAMKAWRLHDLRRTAATLLGGRVGTPPHVIEKLLNHAVPSKVQRIYQRAGYLEERKTAIEGWDRFVTKLVGQDDGAEQPAASNVVSLPQRASA